MFLETSQNSQEFAEDCNFIKKETLAQVISCEFCEISKNNFLTEHLRTASSQIRSNILIISDVFVRRVYLFECIYKGKDTLWNFSFKAFHEIQFQGHFMKYFYFRNFAKVTWKHLYQSPLF